MTLPHTPLAFPAPSSTGSVRLDKWLWAVRVYKTRSQAAEACRHGHITIAEQKAKPSRDVHVGEVIIALKDNIIRTYKVLQLLDHRLSAKLAREFAEDQTPAAELEKLRQPALRPIGIRPKGAGRPTKKERRIIDRWQEPQSPQEEHGP